MKNNKYITIFLGIVLCAIWGNILYQILWNEEQTVEEETNVSFNTTSHTLMRYVYTDTVRDPFLFYTPPKPLSVPTALKPKPQPEPWIPPPYQLTGVITNKKIKTALLHGTMDNNVYFIREGDTLNGIKIIRIEDRNVTFSYKKKIQKWSVE